MGVSGDLGAASAFILLRLDNRQKLVKWVIRNIIRIGRAMARGVVSRSGGALRWRPGGLRTVRRGISLVLERPTSVLIACPGTAAGRDEWRRQSRWAARRGSAHEEGRRRGEQSRWTLQEHEPSVQAQ